MSADNTQEQDNWFHSPRMQRFLGGGLIEHFGIRALGNVQLSILRGHKSKQDVKLINKVRRTRRSLLTVDEYFLILSLAKTFAKKPGAMIEIGTYQGCSARLMCEVKGDKKLYVCDTYEGLPKSHQNDRGVHKTSQYACSLESVSEFMEGFPNVQFVKGFFPQSASGVIISHDYSVLAGVKKAVNELTEELPNSIVIELPTTQAMIIKI